MPVTRHLQQASIVCEDMEVAEKSMCCMAHDVHKHNSIIFVVSVAAASDQHQQAYAAASVH